MAKGVYIGVDDKARKVGKLYVGVDGIARKVKKAYVGVNNVAQLIYEDAIIIPIDIKLTTKHGTVEATVNDETFTYSRTSSTSGTQRYSTTAPIGSEIKVKCMYGGKVWLESYIGGSSRLETLKTATSGSSESYTYTIPEGVVRADVHVQWTSSSGEYNTTISIYDY